MTLPAALLALTLGAAPAPVASGLNRPQAVLAAPDGAVFITAAGELGTDGDGAVVKVENGKGVVLAGGLNDPSGLAAFQQWLFVADRDRVLRVDRKTGKVTPLAAAEAFPAKPKALVALAATEGGTLFALDAAADAGWAVYRVSPRGKAELAVDAAKAPAVKGPRGLALDGNFHLLLSGDSGVHRVRLDGATDEVVAGVAGAGLAWDWRGRLFVADRKAGRVLGQPRPTDAAVPAADGFREPVAVAPDADGKSLYVLEAAGNLSKVPAVVPGFEIDETPAAAEFVPAFADVTWTGWDREPASGKPVPLRPILLTHFGDGSGRTVVPTQEGLVHVLPPGDGPKTTNVFLDLTAKVRYNPKENEEGFLGLAFHPKYKQNGEFFVFFTDKGAKRDNVLWRFRASKDDPDRADPASGEELFRVSRPFWNHDGGTVAFGPDGYLYVALGDGGAANDPFDNGQNLGTVLGKVLRIDVDRKADGKPYAVPKNNPFVSDPKAKPEVWAYGLRNVWRLAFDRKTGELWAADVGQNLWEEVNVLTAGGNYGWRRRESQHAFGADGHGPKGGMIEPVWEYHHDVGKSVTGGYVYRGKAVPELEGHYVYGDYVASRSWALKYDPAAKRAVANRPVKGPAVPIYSYGEDEAGELYLLTQSESGRVIFKLAKDGG